MAWYQEFEALAGPASELVYKGAVYTITRHGTRLDQYANQLSAVCAVRHDNWYRAVDAKGTEYHFLENPNGTFELAEPSRFFGEAPVIAPAVSATNLKYDPNEAKRDAGKLLSGRLQFGFIPGTISFHDDAKAGGPDMTPAHKNTSELTYMHQTLGNLLHHIAWDERATERLGGCSRWPVNSSEFNRASADEIRGWLRCYAMIFLNGGKISDLRAVAPPDKTDPLAARILKKANLK